MNRAIKVGDIFWLKEYIFTDTRETRKHFTLIILPKHWQYTKSTFCSVITSKIPKNNLSLELSRKKYKCFSKDSYACFDRIDLLRLDKEKCSKKCELDLEDIKKGRKLIHKCIGLKHKYYQDNFMIGAFIREWKKRFYELQKR